MVSTPTPPVTIPEKSRLAQLIAFKSCVTYTDPKVQGDQGFGTTGKSQLFWTQTVGEQRPSVECIITMSRNIKTDNGPANTS